MNHFVCLGYFAVTLIGTIMWLEFAPSKNYAAWKRITYGGFGLVMQQIGIFAILST